MLGAIFSDVQAILKISLLLLAAVGCVNRVGFDEPGRPAASCQDVTCSGHGACTVRGDGALECECDPGYVSADALTCIQEPMCANDSDCVGDDVCNTSRCEQGVCLSEPNSGNACDDADPCTEDDTCVDGTCTGVAYSCDDANPCSNDICTGDGNCEHTFNTAPCDDGAPCTHNDTCALGICSGTPYSCDDSNFCTDDLCDGAGGCDHIDSAHPAAELGSLTVAEGVFNDLDVDWTNGLAYAPGRSSTGCMYVFDIQDETAPQEHFILNQTSTPETQGGSCLGARLYNGGRRLVLLSESPGRIEVWDLSANPRDTSAWTRLSVLTESQPRRVMQVVEGVNVTRLYVTLRRGWGYYEIAEPAGTINKVAGVGGLSDYNQGVVLGEEFVLQQRWTGTALGRWDIATETLLDSSSNATAGSNYWTGAISPDGNNGIVAGLEVSFLEYDSAATPEVRATRRFQLNSFVRGAVFNDDGATALLYTATQGRHLDVFDVTDITAPFLVKRSCLYQTDREAYGVSVNPTNTRTALISTAGDIVLLDLDALPNTSFSYPIVPEMTIEDASAIEGEAIIFAVRLSEATTQAISFNWETRDVSADSFDYTPRVGSSSIAPGQTELLLSVPTSDDSATEGEETLELELSNVSRAVPVKSVGVGTIVDND